MEIVFNGRRVDVAAATVADLLAEFSVSLNRIAVEHNRVLLPRSTWAETRLASGDSVEVVQMVGGGA
ncbi:MAG: sulfur carrier protein ThiS [Terriglobales bacterium]